MIRTNFQPTASMASKFQRPGLRGLGAVDFELSGTGTSYVANNVETLGIFKQLQRANNAYFLTSGAVTGALVPVDGKIGAVTFASVLAQVKETPLGPGIILPVTIEKPTGVKAVATNAQAYAVWLSARAGVPLPSASSSILPTDNKGSSYTPGATSTPPVPGGGGAPDLPETKKSGSGIYIAGGLLALGAILLVSKTSQPKRKGFRGCRGMACRGY